MTIINVCNLFAPIYWNNKYSYSYSYGTGYDYPDLPGLGNNNAKLGLPERISTGYRNTIPVQEPISRKKIGLS